MRCKSFCIPFESSFQWDAEDVEDGGEGGKDVENVEERM